MQLWPETAIIWKVIHPEWTVTMNLFRIKPEIKQNSHKTKDHMTNDLQQWWECIDEIMNYIYHVSKFIQSKLEFSISLFKSCIMFRNFMFVFHVDLHAKLVFNIRFIFLPMFKLEYKNYLSNKTSCKVLIATNCMMSP